MRSGDYLSFTKRERTGILTLVGILLVVSIAPKFFCRPRALAEIVPEEQADKLFRKKEHLPYRHAPGKVRDSLLLLKYNYPRRSFYKYGKGGRSHKPYDTSGYVARQYHSPGFYNSSGRYNLPGLYNSSGRYNSPGRYNSSARYNAGPSRAVIDINTADTAAFIALPGIGSRLAARIVLFREKLGGFYDLSQIREVYGLPDSVFMYIAPRLRCDSAYVRKIPLNVADREVLKQHPYIRWNMANALVAYRAQHGDFRSLDDLEK